jgi:hypothetical protein
MLSGPADGLLDTDARSREAKAGFPNAARKAHHSSAPHATIHAAICRIQRKHIVAAQRMLTIHAHP